MSHTIIRLEDMHPRDNARAIDPKLVAEIAESIKLIGFRPDKAIIVVRDGDLYWVVDGEHRRQAALAAGLEEAPAIIETLDDSDVLTFEGALNVQRPDTQQERWARAQQFLLLGAAVKPEQVAVATGISITNWPKVKKASAYVGDQTAFEDMNEAWAIAIADCEDAAKREALIHAKVDEWWDVLRDKPEPPMPPASSDDRHAARITCILMNYDVGDLRKLAVSMWRSGIPADVSLLEPPLDGVAAFTGAVTCSVLARVEAIQRIALDSGHADTKMAQQYMDALIACGYEADDNELAAASDKVAAKVRKQRAAQKKEATEWAAK